MQFEGFLDGRQTVGLPAKSRCSAGLKPERLLLGIFFRLFFLLGRRRNTLYRRESGRIGRRFGLSVIICLTRRAAKLRRRPGLVLLRLSRRRVARRVATANRVICRWGVP